MALQVCKSCSTRYAPAAVCPHCGAGEWIGEVEADELAAQEEAPAKPKRARRAAASAGEPDAGGDVGEG